MPNNLQDNDLKDQVSTVIKKNKLNIGGALLIGAMVLTVILVIGSISLPTKEKPPEVSAKAQYEQTRLEQEAIIKEAEEAKAKAELRKQASELLLQAETYESN